jgi:hypothetical protein
LVASTVPSQMALCATRETSKDDNRGCSGRCPPQALAR